MSSSSGSASGGKKVRSYAPADMGEQAQLLAEAKEIVTREAWQMKRCLDRSKLMDALKHAANMIGELRTWSLSPKNYYELYMATFDELRYLESFLSGDEETRGKKLSELYELVQYAGNVLPRLYLLITVGSVYIREREAPAKDVLRDLVEMCRGVQHPLRGLFLRNFLSEMSKDKLPDKGSEYEGQGGTVHDSVHFILQNFVEMNKLWVRMQHQTVIRDIAQRESERQELKLLVGKCLARLSQLDGVDVHMYSSLVLPRILDQIVNCKDLIAQQYLMEVVIQVFPDEFHLQTLEPLLATCSKLLPSVNVRAIIGGVIDRLERFAVDGGGRVPPDIDIFQVFFHHISGVVETNQKLTPIDALSLLSSLQSLSLLIYPGRRDYVDQILKYVAALLGRYNEKGTVDLSAGDMPRLLTKLLNAPLETYNNVLTILTLEGYARCISFLPPVNHKRVACSLLRNAISNSTRITEAELVAQLFVVIQPILQDAEGAGEPDPEDEEFQEEQLLVGALVHLLSADDPEKQFAILRTARRIFGLGGPARVRYTIPPLVFKFLQLARLLKGFVLSNGNSADPAAEWGRVGSKVFKFIHETVVALSQSGHHELALRLFLQAAQCAAECGFETIAHGFFVEVWTIYEEHIADSKAQYNAVCLIIGTLYTIRVFSDENYESLVTKTAAHSVKLVKKPDQCRAVYLSGHLFWVTGEQPYKEPKRVLERLQKALKVADACVDSAAGLELFVELLNEYLYYFEHDNELVVANHITMLMKLIETNAQHLEEAEGQVSEALQRVNVHFEATLRHIKTQGANPESNLAVLLRPAEK